MTVTTEQMQIAESYGMREVELIAKCCNETGARFYIALAMLEKETGTCRNVYGGDAGGALRGFKGEVNAGSYAVFRWMIDVGVPVKQSDGTHKVIKFGPNGVGPSQITHPDLVARMKNQGLDIHDPHDNIAFGVKLIQSYYRKGRDDGKSVSEALRYAGTRYNGSPVYGDSYLTVALKWKNRVGSADYA